MRGTIDGGEAEGVRSFWRLNGFVCRLGERFVALWLVLSALKVAFQDLKYSPNLRLPFNLNFFMVEICSWINAA